MKQNWGILGASGFDTEELMRQNTGWNILCSPFQTEPKAWTLHNISGLWDLDLLNTHIPAAINTHGVLIRLAYVFAILRQCSCHVGT